MRCLLLRPSSGDANTTTLSAETSLPLVKSENSDKEKGKKIASSTSTAKRAHEGTEVEGPKKRSSQGPHLATVTEFDETMASVVHTPEFGKVFWESSQSLPNYPWTREDFKLPESLKELFKFS